MNERATVALRWLAEKTDAAPPPTLATGWKIPKRTALALDLAFRLREAGLTRPGQRGDHWLVGGAANTLSALKRRGLAANDGGGAWLAARWWITPEGLRAHERGESDDTAG